ncbi:MAG: hypothetical protein ACO242_06180 [Candidatus Fonsibacter ubiquis]
MGVGHENWWWTNEVWQGSYEITRPLVPLDQVSAEMKVSKNKSHAGVSATKE